MKQDSRFFTLTTGIALAISFGSAPLTAEQISCNGISTPTVVISGSQPQSFYFCDGKASEVRDLPIHFKNAGSLLISVREINPLVRSFTVTINGTKYAEVDGSVFAGLLGVPAVTGQLRTPGQTPSTTNGAARAPAFYVLTCSDKYRPTHDAVTKLIAQVNALVKLTNTFRTQVNDLQEKYTTAIALLQTTASPDQSKFLQQVQDLINQSPSAQALSSPPVLSKDDAKTYPTLSDFEGQSYIDIAKALSAQAVKLHGSLPSTTDCAEAATDINQDKKDLESLFDSSGSTTPILVQLQNEVTGSAAAATTLAANIVSLQQIAMDARNFEIDLRIPPEDRVQSSVVVTASWTNKPLPTCAASQTKPSDGSGPVAAGATPAQKPQSQNGTCSTPTQGTTSFTLNFGQGPRTLQSAGIVFSPLTQHSYSLGTPGASTNCPSSAAGCIVDNGAAGWRILPIALATVRFADVPWSWGPWRVIVPNYFSFGATIKSNSNSGTSLEYLPGLSWASPGQHVLFTAGAYGGTTTRLAGGLAVGPQSVTPPTTLPTTTPYHWGFGFAISYAFSSQGGSGSGSQTQTPSSTNQKE